MKKLAVFVFLVLPAICLFGQVNENDSKAGLNQISEATAHSVQNVPTGNNWIEYQFTAEKETMLSKFQFLALLSSEKWTHALPDLDVYFEINGKPFVITKNGPVAKPIAQLDKNTGKYEIVLPKNLIAVPKGPNTIRLSFFPVEGCAFDKFEYVSSLKSQQFENRSLIFGYKNADDTRYLNGNFEEIELTMASEMLEDKATNKSKANSFDDSKGKKQTAAQLFLSKHAFVNQVRPIQTVDFDMLGESFNALKNKIVYHNIAYKKPTRLETRTVALKEQPSSAEVESNFLSITDEQEEIVWENIPSLDNYRFYGTMMVDKHILEHRKRANSYTPINYFSKTLSFQGFSERKVLKPILAFLNLDASFWINSALAFSPNALIPSFLVASHINLENASLRSTSPASEMKYNDAKEKTYTLAIN